MNGYERQEILDEHERWLESDGREGKRADFELAELQISFQGADLRRANLQGAQVHDNHLRDADLRGANLIAADLTAAGLEGARLEGAQLNSAKLIKTKLRRANLSGADLRVAQLVSTDLREAVLTGCRVYGTAVWDVRINDGTDQTDLVVSRGGAGDAEQQSTITVDDLEVAQFIYLILNNEKLHNVIDTVTSKSVLILGRFSSERKSVLGAIREDLRNRNLVPILFDWPRSERRNLTETVQLLAAMARFVIADITDAKSIPQELSHVVPHFPSVPVQPIILASQKEYSMFESWADRANVLPQFAYDDQAHLLASLESRVIDPVEVWERESDKGAARERLAADERARLEAEIAGLKQALAERGD